MTPVLVAGLVLALLPSQGAVAAYAGPTSAQIAQLRNQVTVYVKAGAIASPGVADSLMKKLDEAQRARERGGPAAARRSLDAFRQEVGAERGKHISASAADALIAVSKGEAPPTTTSLTPGMASTVATAVGTSTVVVDVPANTSIASISVEAPTPTTPVPKPPSQQKAAASIVVTAVDASGQPISVLPKPIQISIVFALPPAMTATGATIVTLSSTGANEPLTTTVGSNGDGTFTASAPTPHLSPFVVFVPPTNPVVDPAVVTTILGGYAPQHVAVNNVTNRAYVSVPTDGAVAVIDGTTNRLLPAITVGSTPSGLAVDPSTNRLYVSASGAHKVFVVDGATNAVTAAITFDADLPYPEALAFDGTTRRLYVVHLTGVVSVVDTTSNSVVQRIDLNRNAAPLAAAVNPATGRVYVSNCNDKTVSIIDGPSGTLLGAVAIGPPRRLPGCSRPRPPRTPVAPAPRS